MAQFIGTPTHDGYIDRQYESTWSDARNAAAGDAIDEGSDAIYLRSETGFHCSRMFLTFDLTTVPAGTDISSATLAFDVASVSVADAAHGTANLVSGSPANVDDYVLDDFDQFGTTAFATEVDASSAGAYSFTINAAGLTYLEAACGGKVVLCMRMKKDFDNTTPTGAGYIVVYTSKSTTESYKPTLTINYIGSSFSPSLSPSLSPSRSPSLSPSLSPSRSPSRSPSLSPSVSPSVSLSPSRSPSLSPSLSPSASPSVSPSVSLSPSRSPSISPSVSPSISLSPSLSPSVSPSASPSVSPSVSLSPSVSPSVSPSPSPGWQGYTRGDYAALPTNNNDLENVYSAQDYLDVASKDDTRVGQSATGQFAIHQFKDYVGVSASCSVEWEGQTNCANTFSTVYLQVYNQTSGEWETIDSDNTTGENTDFPLSASIPDLTNYKDGSSVVSCRVYQEAV